MRSKSLPIIQILFLACHCSVRFTSAKVAGFGKPSGGVKTPLEESDKGENTKILIFFVQILSNFFTRFIVGMPLTHP